MFDNLPSLTPLFWFAGFGLVVAVLLIMVGVPSAIWYLAHHLAWH